MKHNKINLLVCIFIIACLLDQTMGGYLRNLRSTKTHKKHHLKDKKVSSQEKAKKTKDPVNQQIIKSTIYDQDLTKPNEVEQNPNGYKYVGPFTQEQEKKLFPQKVYQKDKKNYNMNEATPENIQNEKVVMVRNMTAAKEQFKDSKFFDGREQFDPIAKSILAEQYKSDTSQSQSKLAVYQNDQKAYYNPINEKNIFSPQDNGLFMVPIALQEKESDNEEVKKQIENQRLAHKASYYYDASALFDVPRVDKLQETLRESAKINAEPKAQKLNEWVKSEDQKKENVQALLGSPVKEYESDNRSNVVTNILKNQDIQQSRQKAEEHPLPKIKGNEKAPYYNGGDKKKS